MAKVVVAKLGLKRSPDKMLYIKDGCVWSVGRKRPGVAKSKAVKVASIGVPLDYSKNLYFISKGGDVVAASRKGVRKGAAKKVVKKAVKKAVKAVKRKAVKRKAVKAK